MGRLAQAIQHTKAEALHHLRRMILRQELQPSTDLDEVTLCRHWNLSRRPMRDLLRQPASEAFVGIRENRAARLAEMPHRILPDFFLAAPIIYSAILRLAAENAQENQIAALKPAQATFRNTLSGSSNAARVLANNRFHEITGEMAVNP